MIRAYLELTKPRITVMVAATTLLGAWLSGGRDWAAIGWAVLGTALVSASSGALNQWLEREEDARMLRTRGRPLPSGRLDHPEALFFGLSLAVAGLGVLAFQANALAFGLAGAAWALYCGAYTPLKRVSPQSTWVGAVSGALPPVIGWAAMRGSLDLGAWLLFGIQFFWQIPHFLALFWLYREDYARAGFRLMPVIDPDGATTALQIAVHSLALWLATLAPFLFGREGLAYGYGALVMGTLFLALGLRASWTLAARDARRLFLGSLAYLPSIFALLVWA